jgi:hypothetical protein
MRVQDQNSCLSFYSFLFYFSLSISTFAPFYILFVVHSFNLKVKFLTIKLFNKNVLFYKKNLREGGNVAHTQKIQGNRVAHCNYN